MGTQKHRVSFQEENYQLAEAVHKMYGFKNVSELINSALEEWLVKKPQNKLAVTSARK